MHSQTCTHNPPVRALSTSTVVTTTLLFRLLSGLHLHTQGLGNTRVQGNQRPTYTSGGSPPHPQPAPHVRDQRSGSGSGTEGLCNITARTEHLPGVAHLSSNTFLSTCSSPLALWQYFPPDATILIPLSTSGVPKISLPGSKTHPPCHVERWMCAYACACLWLLHPLYMHVRGSG